MYGYGVVLLELLTGQVAIDHKRIEDYNLVGWVISLSFELSFLLFAKKMNRIHNIAYDSMMIYVIDVATISICLKYITMGELKLE